MADCNHDCGSCGADCSERQENPGIQKAPMNAMSHIKKVIGVVSGKGGVGKSSITSLLATAAQKQGFSTAVLDADITGPSIPKAFGIHEKAQGNGEVLLPAITRTGIKTMSINLLLENDTDPVVWRGPILGGVVEQFWSDVVWGDIDYMFSTRPTTGMFIILAILTAFSTIIETSSCGDVTMMIPSTGKL